MSIILTVMLVLSCIPMSAISVSAATDLTTIIDTGAKVRLTDTNNDGYYEIDNADDLYAFSAIVNGGNTSINAILTDDITVNSGTMTANSTGVRAWTPIGKSFYYDEEDDEEYDLSFAGVFDGNNKTISGLFFKNSNAEYVGLFGYANKNSEIKNVTVENSYFSASECVGGVVGDCDGKVTNCHNNSTICGDNYIGGVIGFGNAKLTDCSNTGTVNGIECIGGVAGYNRNTTTNCYNAGTISGESNVGGVVGNSEYSEITNCYNMGEINGNIYVGGITGINNDGKTANSYNKGTVNGEKRVGGVVGNSSSTIEKCYNTGAVNGYEYVGGVVGICYKIINCYNTGTVSGSFSVGGIVGLNDMGTITNCYNTGKISAEKFLGAISGNGDRGTVTNCYYLNTSCLEGIGYKDVTGSAEAKTSEQFASGEVAYLLGDAFGQEIGVDEIPVIGGKPVYKTKKDNGDIIYTNQITNIEHKYDSNGFCTVCENCYQPATDSNNDSYYEIDNAGKLYWFANEVKKGWTTINVILTDYITVNEGKITSGSTNAKVWTPIGNDEYKYAGNFNGNYKTISGLYYNNNKTENVGLFGYTYENSEIKNLTVENSYFCGKNYVGGIVGSNYGKITYCKNSSTVTGSTYLGGIVGSNYGTINKSINTGAINGTSYIGGIAGKNEKTITNCYNTGSVKANSYDGGGIAGYCYESEIINCYNTGTVEAADGVGGIVGYRNGSPVRNCYYLDTSSSGGINNKDYVGSAEAKTSTQFAYGEVAYLLGKAFGQEIGVDYYPVLGGNPVCKIQTANGDITYINKNGTEGHNFDANGFDPICKNCFEPAIDSNNDGYYEIDNAGKLYWFAEEVQKGWIAIKAILTADITINESTMSENSTDVRVWTPIGNSELPFYGKFNGNNKTVSGLYYNDKEVSFVGLFGCTGENSEIKDVTIDNTYFCANDYVGAIVGKSLGTVTNCCNKNSIYGSICIGGIVGYSEGTVSNCCNMGAVRGELLAGGIVGENHGVIANSYNKNMVYVSVTNAGGITSLNSGTVTNCYNKGSIYGSSNIGGIVGYGDSNKVENCYYLDTSCSGGIGNSNVVGSAEAKTSRQFASGEVAYLLGEAFGQEIDVDELPVLGGKPVCKIKTDNGDIKYINKNGTEGHKFNSNGFDPTCKNCFEPAIDSNNDGYYEINNAGKLYWFAKEVNKNNNSINAILTADITVNEGAMNEYSTYARVWTPIGSETNPYNGKFDGNNKTVFGLYCNDKEVSFVGLFGYTGKNSVIEDVTIENAYFKTNDYVGAVVGNNLGLVTNCCNKGTIDGSICIGGIAGYSEGIVSNCCNMGVVKGQLLTGGIVGENHGVIANSYNTEMVSISVTNVGGIAGLNAGTVTNCYNTGSIYGSSNIGGIVGYDNGDKIENCYYLDTSCTGGIGNSNVVGSAEAKTSKQFASGEVAYLLGEAFGQEIGVEDLPILGGNPVYESTDGNGNIIYINSYENEGHIPETIEGYDATCTQTGLTDGVVCSVCGEIIEEQEVIPAKGHTRVTIKGYSATCTKTGLTDGVKCSDCGEIITAQAVIPAKGHNYNTDGYCTDCGVKAPVENEPSNNMLYFKPCSNWHNNGARFVAYVWSDNAEKFIDLYDTDGDGYYEFSNDNNWENVIFCRLSSSAQTSWDNVWNQTDDLVIPTDGNNCYTLAEGSWSNGNGTWSKYDTPVKSDMGDIDLDGIVSIRDVSTLSKYLVGCESLTQAQLDVADVNGDGEININDATYIQKMLVELV